MIRIPKADLFVIALCLLALLAVALWGCSPVRVAPVGTLAEDPSGGGWTMNRDLPQPKAEDYQPGAGVGGFLQMAGAFLPEPWREIVLMLSTTLVAKKVAESPLKAALQQTVNGIELAKADNPSALPAIHARLAETQDERTKRLVWNLRP